MNRVCTLYVEKEKSLLEDRNYSVKVVDYSKSVSVNLSVLGINLLLL